MIDQTTGQQSQHADAYASLSVDEKITLRGAFVELLSFMQTRIDRAYWAGEYDTEGHLCDTFMVIYRAFNRCEPYPAARP